MTIESLEDRIRAEIRLSLRLTGTSQAELARKLGLSKKHVNQVLLGNAALSLDLAERMLAALGRMLPVRSIPLLPEVPEPGTYNPFGDPPRGDHNP